MMVTLVISHLSSLPDYHSDSPLCGLLKSKQFKTSLTSYDFIHFIEVPAAWLRLHFHGVVQVASIVHIWNLANCSLSLIVKSQWCRRSGFNPRARHGCIQTCRNICTALYTFPMQQIFHIQLGVDKRFKDYSTDATQTPY